MAINDEAKESVENAAPVTPGAGLNPNDPAAVARINDAMKMRGGDVFRSTLMGAGMGAQAAQGAVNPLVAFIQGAAAGLQAPAQIFAEKRAQIQSALDASPFQIANKSVFDELVSKNPNLSWIGGIPNKLAMEMIKTIGTEGAKIHAEHQAKLGEMQYTEFLKGKSPSNLADQLKLVKDFEDAKVVRDYQNVNTAFADILSAPADIIGDKTRVIKYAQMLNPTVRVNEQTMDSMDASGSLDALTKDLWAKVKGKGLMGPEERKKITQAAAKINARAERDYTLFRSAIVEKAADAGFDASLLYQSQIHKFTNPKTGEVIYGRLVNGEIVTEE